MKRFLITAVSIFCSIAVFSQTNDTEAVKKVLNSYKKAIEKLDTSGVVNLFVKDSKVFEQAKNEGTIGNYLEHDLALNLKILNHSLLATIK